MVYTKIFDYVIAWVAVKFGITTMSAVLYRKWNKFHEAKPSKIFHLQYNMVFIPNSIPMLFHVNTILADFSWCFHVYV